MTASDDNEKKYYVYGHYKKTTGEIFYVGKGCGYRAWRGDMKGRPRNGLWRRIADKHGYRVEILKDELDESSAFELERELIALHGRRDLKTGTLANMTDGGEGVSGHKYTPTTERLAKNAASNIAFIKNNPDAHKERQRMATLAKQSTEARTANSKRRVKYFQENPTASLAQSERLKDFYKKNSTARLRLAKPVLCIETGVIYESASAAARATGVDHSSISRVARGAPRYKTAGGFHWEYVTAP